MGWKEGLGGYKGLCAVKLGDKGRVWVKDTILKEVTSGEGTGEGCEVTRGHVRLQRGYKGRARVNERDILQKLQRALIWGGGLMLPHENGTTAPTRQHMRHYRFSARRESEGGEFLLTFPIEGSLTIPKPSI